MLCWSMGESVLLCPSVCNSLHLRWWGRFRLGAEMVVGECKDLGLLCGGRLFRFC